MAISLEDAKMIAEALEPKLAPRFEAADERMKKIEEKLGKEDEDEKQECAAKAAAVAAAAKADTDIISAQSELAAKTAALTKIQATEMKCPHCGSTDTALAPPDFETLKCKACGKSSPYTDEKASAAKHLHSEAAALDGKLATLKAEARKQRAIAAGANGAMIEAMAGLITDGIANATKGLVTDGASVTGGTLATDAGGTVQNGGPIAAEATKPERKTLSAATARFVSKFEQDNPGSKLTEQSMSAAMSTAGVPVDKQMATLIELGLV